MKRIAVTRQDRFLFKRRLISVAVVSAVSSHAGANPTGPQVVNGQAGFATQGSVLTITNTPNAIVNWQSFSIGTHETTRFVQQSAASAVLNRVVGVDPSVILGTLQSNGKVFLVNPSGILFGQGAHIDVAGLVASTLNLNDADFLAGRLNFESGPLSGSVVNRGVISTREGGSVFLVGAAVENSGIIRAPNGEVILAAGQTVRLGSTAAPNVLVEVEAPANRAVNLGELAVGNGKAGIYGGFIEQKGIVSADTATVNAAGKIVFKATRDVNLAATSVTSAGGAQGGMVTVESGGTTLVEGVVSATGTGGSGGSIRLLGEQVGVTGSAAVDASGTAGGGSILAGGDYKGMNSEVHNARATFVGADALLRADATGAGDGGRVIVWSDEATRAYGRISARGGPAGGDGGFVETSSRRFLDVRNAPDLIAPMGHGGTWLLDPFNVLVTLTTGSLDALSPTFAANGNDSTISNTAIQAALDAGQNVIIDTGSSGAQAGDITVARPIAKTAGGDASLTLRAADNIYLSAVGITSSSGALSVTLNSDTDGASGGAVWLQSGSSIVTNGGSLTIGGGANPLTTASRASGDILEGVRIEGASINTGAGAISIRGEGSGTGVLITNSSTAGTTVRSSSGDISIVGVAGAAAGDGVRIASDNSVLGVVVNTIGTGSITITGSVPVSQTVSAGVSIVQAGVAASGSAGSVSITGSNVTTGSGTAYAVHVDGGGTGASVASYNGLLQIQSTAGSIATQSASSSATIAAYAGDVLLSSAGPIVLGAGTEITAGGNVEVYTDFLDENARFIQSGAAAANYVRWAPTTPGLNVDLTEILSNNYLTPRLQIGNPIGNSFGTVTITAVAEASDFSSVTKSLEVYAQRVDIDASLGAVTPLPLSLVVKALGDITVGNGSSTTIRLGDGQKLSLLADSDGDGFGDLTIGRASDSYVDIRVDYASSATPSSMELRGANVLFQGNQNVWLYGPGTQTIAAEHDVRLSITGPDLLYLSVGSAGLTDVSVGHDFIIESLGDGVAQIAGDFSAPGGLGAVNISAAGAVRLSNAAFPDSGAYIFSQQGQTIAANSLQMLGAAGGTSVGLQNDVGAQTITTTGSGPNGWGIELINNGSLDGFNQGVYLNTNNALQMTALDGGGILLDNKGGPVSIYSAGAQVILADGSGANAIELRGGPGETIINGASQTITAGTAANPGSIVLLGGSVRHSTAGIYYQTGTQRVSTTGQLRLIAGTAPDDGQGSKRCDVQGCANIGSVTLGADQVITADSIVLQGGSDGGRNEANIFTAGNQSVTAPGGITILGGAGPGPGNWGSLAIINSPTAVQTVSFGAGGLTIRSSDTTAGDESTASVYADGAQAISGTGDILITGGLAGSRSYAQISAQTGQNITARSITIVDRAGPSSSGIFTQSGLQTITTSGGPGGDSAGYGITLLNLGATGPDQAGNTAAAYITTRTGTQSINVANSRGILIEGAGGLAIIDAEGSSQTLSVGGALDLRAGLGSAQVYFANGSGQSIDAGSITLTGGTADRALALIEAAHGTQDITVGGALTLRGGTAPGPDIPDLSNPPADCGAVSGCAVVIARTELQTISANAISITGGSAGTENLATIRSDAGQDITIGSGGLTMQGGAGPGLRNYAFIENYGNDQILRFAAGAPLTLTGGTDGSKHFAAIGALPGTTSQQILGTPVITLTGGASGGGDGTGAFVTFKGNNAAIYTDPGAVASQTVNAQSIDLQGGGGGDNNAVIDTFGPGAPQTITVVGDVRLHGGTALGTHAEFLSFGDQSVSARSIQMIGAAGGATAALYTQGGNQDITTTGAGPNGWGIELINHGPLDGQSVYINSSAGQHIEALNGGGILLDAVAGSVEMRANGAQNISIDGATSANALVVRGVAGRAEIHAQSQSIVAGSAGSGSITVQGGSANFAQAFVFTDAGTQNISTSGELHIIAGSAPDLGQPPLNCSLGGACALIGNVFEGSDPGSPIQTITAVGGISIVGGSTGAHNDTGIFSRGSQVIDAPGGITLQAGGEGPNNFATIAMDRAGYSQTVDFGTGGLTILSNVAGADGNFAEVYSSGTQVITGSSDIRLEGGVADGRSWAHIVGVNGQDISARSLTIVNNAGQSSTGLYTENGVQRIATSGGAGGLSSNFGLTLQNLGEIGTDQNGFPAAVYITNRNGQQIIDVVDSAGVRLLSGGGAAIINVGQLVLGIVDAQGVSQSITVRGSGANAILLHAGAGDVEINSYSSSQTITAGPLGEAGSISILGGTSSVARAGIVALTGTQTIRTAGAMTLVGGATPSTPGTIDFGQLDCLPACANVLAKTGQQTIDADSILLQGGASGNENLASIRSNAGQNITIRGAGGMRILGGGELDNDNAFSNFAMLENYAGAQVITFLTPGAPLTIDAGDQGMRHFAGIYNGGIDGGGQQILGSPTIRVSGGNGGSGGQGADRFTFTSNLAFIGSESGTQEIAADSIELIAGTANFAVADLTNWGGDLPGSATGAQSISVLHGLTLRGGTGDQAYARLYSHSGPQTIDVDGTLVLQRTGAGDVFLGNVFDASVANIGAATVTVNATGGIQLQGGNLWADESLILSLGSSSSVTGGAMHVGRTSAPTTGGDIVVDPTGSLHLSGSLTLSGSVTNQGLLAYSAGTLTVANGATNEGILQLTTTAADTPASVYVFGGQFVNAAGGTVQSLTAGGASANTLQGNVINQGLIDATHFLTVNNGGTVFDTTSGTLQAGTDSILTINGGTVRMGTGTDFGAGSGIIDLGGSLALELASDLTIPASGAHLRLSGSVGIAPGPGVSAVSLINAGALDLSNGSLDGAVTLVNQGDLTLRDTNGAGALSNLADGTVHVYGNANSMGQVSNSGLIELIAAADSGAQLSIYSTDLAFTNEASGVIHSLSAGAPATNYNSLYVYQSSGSAGGGVVNRGTIVVDHPLQVGSNNNAVFDTSAGTVEIAGAQTLTVTNGGLRIGGNTNFGSHGGTLDLAAGVLELASDVTVQSSGGAQLGLSGSIAIAPAPGVSAVTLTNAGALDLSDDSLNGGVTLVNQAALTLRNTNGAGLLNNLLSGTVQVHSNANYMGQVSNSGVIELIADTDSGARLYVYSADPTLTNEPGGVIHSLSAGAPATNYNSLYVYHPPGSAGGGVFNRGTIAVDHPLQVGSNNNALFDTSAGTVEIAGGQTLTVTNGSLRIGGTTNFGTSGGTLDLASGGLELASDVTAQSSGGAQLGLSGSIGIAPAPGVSAVTLTNAGALDLSNDLLSGAVTLVNQGTLAVANTNVVGTLSNAASGTVQVHSNGNYMGLVSNSGVIELIADAGSGAALYVYGVDPTLTNEASGVIRSLSAGAPATNYNTLYVFHSTGSAGGGVVNRGTIAVDHPLQVGSNNNAVLDTTAGTVQVAGGQTLTVANGSLRIGGNTNFGTGGGTLDIASGVLELESDVTVQSSGGAQLGLSGSILIGSAPGVTAVTLTNAGALDISNDTVSAAVTLSNQGTLVAGSDLVTDISGSYYTGTSSTINGPLTTGTSSTIRIEPGATLYVANGFVNNGQIELDRATTVYGGSNYDASARLSVSAGTLVNAGTILSTGAGAATAINYLDLAGGYNSSGTLPYDFTVLNGAGTLQVDAPLQVNHTYGTVDLSAATVAVPAGQTLSFYSAGSGLPTYDGKVIVGGANLVGSRGTLELQSSNVLELSSDLTNDPAGGVTLSLGGSNIVNAASGQKILTNLGTLELTNDTVNTSLANQGTLKLRNSTIGGPIDAGSTVGNQGTLVAASNLVVDANGSYYNGTSSTINGTLTTAAGSTIQVEPGSTLFVSNGFVSNGLIELDRASTVYGGSNYDANANLTVVGGALTNAGTILSTGAGAAISSLNAGVNNRGVLDAQQSLNINGPTTTNVGTVRVASGAILAFSSGLDNQTDGVVTGSGTISVGAVGFSNSGRIAPGASPGTLTIAGDLTLTSSSVLDIELEGTGTGQYDVIDVTGTAALDGRLNVLFPGAYKGGIGDSFQILTASLVSGAFANVTTPAGVAASATYSTTDVVLNLDSVLNRWIAGSGLWTVGSNWTLGVPSAAQDAVIEVANSLETITIPSGSDLSVGSLTLNGEVLRVLDSRLGIGTFASLDVAATLDLTNSSIVGTGALTNQGLMTLTGSSIAIPVTNSGTLQAMGAGNVLSAALTTMAGSVLRVAPGGSLGLSDAFVNNGTIELQRSGTAVASLAIDSQTTLVNAGTILSTGIGTGANALQLKNGRVDGSTNVVLQNLSTGRVQADADLLVNHYEGVVEADNGTFDVAAGQTLDLHNYGNAFGPNVRLGPATIFGTGTGTIDVSDGTVMLTGNLTLPAGGPQFKFRGPSVDGAGFTLTNDSVLTLNGEAVNVPLVNNGTVVVDGPRFAGTTNFVTLAGALTANPGSNLQIEGGGWLTVNNAFTNQGTITLDSTTAGTTFDGANLRVAAGAISNAGTIRSQSSGGSEFNRIQNDVTSTGKIEAVHDLTVTGALTIPNSATGAVITGDGDLTVDGVLTINGSGGPVTIGGTGALVTNGASAVNGGQLLVDTRNWHNFGAMTIGGGLTLDNGAVLTNEAGATLTLGGTNGTPIAKGTGALGTVSNAGTLTKISTAVQTIQTAFDNSGTLTVSAGTLDLAADGEHSGTFTVSAAGAELGFVGGTHTFGATAFGGPGVVRVNGATLDFGTATGISNPFVLQTGTIRGVGDLTLDGAFALSGGTISGAGVLVTNAATTENNGTALLDGRTWSNSGAMVINGRINLGNGATLVNQTSGTIDVAAGNTNTLPLLWNGTGARATLRNLGTVTKSAALAQQLNLALDNRGTLNVATGALRVDNFAGGANDGAISISAGATLSTNGSSLTNATTGAIDVAGSLDLGGAALTNAGALSITGGDVVTTGSFANSGTTTLQAGTLNVGAVTNSGTLDLNGGTFARTAGRTFGNSGTVHLNTGTLSLDAGDGGVSGGDYAVGSGTTLEFTGGSYSVGSLGGAGSSQINGGTVTAADVSVATGGQLDVSAGALSSTGALSNAGSVMASGGSLHAGSIDNAGGGDFAINGATVSAGPFTNAGKATLQSGSLSVGAVTNSGTLNLNGGTFTRTAGSSFGNSGTVHLRNITLSLDGGDGGGGGVYDVGSAATLRFTGGSYSVASLGGAGSSEIDGGNVTAANVSVPLGGQLRMLAGALSSTGALTNAGTVVASGGSLHAGSIDNDNGGGLTISGATVTTGPLTNAGTATLQSGALSVGAVTNSGTLNLNGGTFTRSAGAAFGNSGTVHLNTGTLSLGGGDSGGGTYDVGSGATLRFTGGTYAVGSLGGAGSREINGANVTATDVAVASGGQLQLLAGSLRSSGALTNDGSVVARGGSLNAGSIDNASAGSFLINGATVATGPLTNAGTATLQSGTLSVGAVTNSGTLNLNGGTFTRRAHAVFGNSDTGTVNLNAGTLSLDGGDGGIGGGSYNLGSATTLRFTGGTYGVDSITGAGNVQVEGIDSPAKVYWTGTMKIAAQTVTVQAGTYSASIDPPDLTLNVPGGVTLTGGSGNNAYALIAGDNVSITTSAMTLAGGAGSGSYAGIQALSGAGTITVASTIDLVPGTGGPSAGAWMSAAGPLTVSALSCNGCAVLPSDPALSGDTGLFGNPVRLPLFGAPVQVPPSVLVGVQTAQTGGEGAAVLSEEEQEEEKKEQSGDEVRARKEEKHDKPLQVCM